MERGRSTFLAIINHKLYNKRHMVEKQHKVSKRDLSRERQFPGQHEDEQVVAVVRQYPVVLRIPLIIGLVIILVGMVPWALASNYVYSLVAPSATFMWICFAVLAFYWLRCWAGWYYSVYVLTTGRLIVIQQKGFFNRLVSELALNNVQNVNYHINGFNAALFGFGDILVQTLSGSGNLDLKLVHHPAVFQQQILDAVHKHGSTSTPVS